MLNFNLVDFRVRPYELIPLREKKERKRRFCAASEWVRYYCEPEHGKSGGCFDIMPRAITLLKCPIGPLAWIVL